MPQATFFIRLIILLFLSLACGCGDKMLVDHLSSRQAVEILVALQRSGIEADREQVSSGKLASYQILVAPADYAQALSVLHEYRLLPDEDSSATSKFGDGKSLIPLPPELMAMQLDQALGAEIERVINAYPEVIAATVAVRSKYQPNAALGNVSSAASHVLVLVRFVPGEQNTLTSEIIQHIVTQTVPNVQPADIDITLSPTALNVRPEASQTSIITPFGFRVAQSDARQVRIQLFATALGVLGFGFLLGFSMAWFRRRSVKPGRGMRRETTMLKNSFLVEGAIRPAEPRRGGRGK